MYDYKKDFDKIKLELGKELQELKTEFICHKSECVKLCYGVTDRLDRIEESLETITSEHSVDGNEGTDGGCVRIAVSNFDTINDNRIDKNISVSLTDLYDTAPYLTNSNNKEQANITKRNNELVHIGKVDIDYLLEDELVKRGNIYSKIGK